MEITDLKLDFDAIEPAYLQLANQLAQEIEKGKYQPGSALPSILTLSRKLAVSKSTVYRAYAHLSSKGLVYWVKFEGFFVKATNRRLL